MRFTVAVLLAAAAVASAQLQAPTFGDDPRKPIDVTPKLICHSCNAAVLEAATMVCPPRPCTARCTAAHPPSPPPPAGEGGFPVKVVGGGFLRRPGQYLHHGEAAHVRIHSAQDDSWLQRVLEPLRRRIRGLSRCLSDSLSLCPRLLPSPLVFVEFSSPQGRVRGCFFVSLRRKSWPKAAT